MKRIINWWRKLRWWSKALIILVVFWFALSAFMNITNITFTSTKGPSMQPTLTSPDRIITMTNIKPKPNDIIVITHKLDGVLIAKRLIKIDDKDCYYLLGDNPSNSYDSRYYGWVCPQDRSNVAVVVWYKNLK